MQLKAKQACIRKAFNEFTLCYRTAKTNTAKKSCFDTRNAALKACPKIPVQKKHLAPAKAKVEKVQTRRECIQSAFKESIPCFQKAKNETARKECAQKRTTKLNACPKPKKHLAPAKAKVEKVQTRRECIQSAFKESIPCFQKAKNETARKECAQKRTTKLNACPKPKKHLAEQQTWQECVKKTTEEYRTCSKDAKDATSRKECATKRSTSRKACEDSEKQKRRGAAEAKKTCIKKAYGDSELCMKEAKDLPSKRKCTQARLSAVRACNNNQVKPKLHLSNLHNTLPPFLKKVKEEYDTCIKTQPVAVCKKKAAEKKPKAQRLTFEPPKSIPPERLISAGAEIGRAHV